MFRLASKMSGVMVDTIDGPAGRIEQILFNNKNWLVRYLVVDLGMLFNIRQFLLSPVAVEGFEDDKIKVNCSKERIKGSPEIGPEIQISPQKEKEIHDHFSWPYYWNYPSNSNSLGRPVLSETLTESFLKLDERIVGEYKYRLESSSGMSGFRVEAINEEVGKIDDLIFDDEEWVVRYLLINTGIMFSNKRIPFSPWWVRWIDWEEGVVYVNYPAAEITNGPEWDTSGELDREFEFCLYRYFDRPPYWK